MPLHVKKNLYKIDREWGHWLEEDGAPAPQPASRVVARPPMEATGAAAAAGFRPTTTSESPGHGITRSSRRQNQTDLSKIFSTSLLILPACNNFVVAHPRPPATLLKLSMVSTAKPCADSSWPIVARL